MMRAGTRLDDRYVLVDVIRRGSLGEVWRAHDTTLDRVVAVRFFPASLSDPDFMRRVRARARVIAGLDDPTIVGIYDYGDADGIAYLVMQFVEGESLPTLLRRVGPLAPPEAMNLIAQAARALHAAHRIGILHADLKTSDLLVRPDGRLLVSDFGIARIVSGEPMTDFVVGCGPYIAPEHVVGSRPTPSADIYALGVVAYECLTLAHPFPGDDPPPPLPPGIPKAVRDVVMRALDRDPRSRWLSAEAMGAAAAAAIGHPG